MSQCPHHKVRADLPPLIPRIAKLPVDERGYPVPFFVQWINEDGSSAEPGKGRPEFRMMDGLKWTRCVKEKLCWVCGEPLGRYFAFVLGPMCTVNMITSEPPSHLDCATWSVAGCPFLSKPQMVRRTAGLPENAHEENIAGHAILSNPGVMAVWVTKSYQIFSAGNGYLINVGPYIEKPAWFKEGRTATTEEILHAIEAGVPKLMAACDQERPEVRPDAIKELEAAVQRVKTMVQGGTNACVPSCG